jgi:hypothetical protein
MMVPADVVKWCWGVFNASDRLLLPGAQAIYNAKGIILPGIRSRKMKRQSRRKFPPDFKAKVALEAVKNQQTLAVA